MSLTFDLGDFRRIARGMQAFERQIPFALAQALNAAAEIARRDIIETTWAQHIKVRNPNFLKAALSSKGARATKTTLRVEIYDKLGRGSLLQHDAGGVKRPRGAALAMPVEAIKARRTGRGVPKGLRPRSVPNSFKQGDAIYQRVGTYTKATQRTPAQDNRHLRLVYVLKPSVRMKPDVPFHADFERTMRRAVPIQFRLAMHKAMSTAFRR